MSFYDRQKSLKLNTDISISVCGCGGIGFWVSKFAVLSGIETISVWDPDIFEAHNLNRIDIPLKFIGRNKTDVVRLMIESIRPDCSIHSFPFKYSQMTAERSNWVIDCTDNISSQTENQKISDKIGARYLKSGYNGEHISINDRVAEWGEAEDGYTVIPSWVVPASIIAALTVGKIMKYKNKEISTNLVDLYV